MIRSKQWFLGGIAVLAAVALLGLLATRMDLGLDAEGPPEGGPPAARSGIEALEPAPSPLGLDSPAESSRREPIASESKGAGSGAASGTSGEPGSVVGTVLERAGVPVAGVVVKLARTDVEEESPSAPRAEEAPPNAASGADGAFRIEGVAPGRYVLTAVHGDFAMVTLDWLRIEPGARVQAGTLVLSPGGTIRGTVTDERGAPIPGARVLAVLQRRLGLGIWRTPGPAAVTDADGRYEIRNVPAGRKVVYAGADGFATDAVSGVMVDERAAVAGIDFALERAQSITGLVLDVETGEPVAGATVFASPSRSTDPTRTNAATDADGRFELAGLSAIEFRVSCSKEGYIPSEGQTARGGMQLKFHLQRNGGLRGTVLGPAGQPVPAFTVRYGLADGEGIGGVGQRLAFEDPEGRFEIDGLNPGAYRVEIRAPGCGPRTSPLLQIGRGAWREGITITLGAEAVLAGIAIDSRTGEPLEGAALVARPGGQGRGRAESAFDLLRAGPTGPDGVLVLDGLGAGRYWVEVSHPELAPQVLQEVEVSAGERRDLGPLVLVQGGTVEGTVRDVAGDPMLMARLLLRGEAYQAYATTEAEGRYVFSRVPPGRYELGFSADGVRGAETAGRAAVAVLVSDGEASIVDF